MYDAIVVGSGFGGAVSACRLAQAGLSVAIIERGRRYPLGGFPRDWTDPLNGWLYAVDQGLFDVKPIQEMLIVEAAGYGGGSLIYANVHLRCPEDVFQRGWPVGYSRAVLDPYYDLAAYMLDIKPVEPGVLSPGQPPALPPKTLVMQQVAADLGRAGQFIRPNIAVNFDLRAGASKNKFGVLQSGCSYCGECVIGCQTHAKNTLDLNYLAIAEQTGRALVFSQCEVSNVVPIAGGYEVHWENKATGARDTAQARAVFLCAGAINTTALLLRCRDEHRSLPDLSPALGTRYSANGDFLGFAFSAKVDFDPAVGPTITTGIVYGDDDPDPAERTWFILEEGGYPKEIARLIQLFNPHVGRVFSPSALRDDIEDMVRDEASRRIAREAQADDRTAVFLSMGRDRADGRIELGLAGAIRILWDVPANGVLYDTESRLNADVARALGGDVALPPTWQLLHQPVSVHNLGGCVMADTDALGVVSPNGEVFRYPDLYVMDGAALPSATGVNPSHTIAAVAERNIEAAIRRLTNNPAWEAPERAKAPRIVDPIDGVTRPSAPPKTESVGLQFQETLRGFVKPGAVAGVPTVDDYVAAFDEAKVAGDAAHFTLTLTIPDLDRFLADQSHTAIARGTVVLSGEANAVTSGVFNMFSPGDARYSRKMLYALPFYGSDGKAYLLDGFRDIRDHGDCDVLEATTTLYTAIREGHTRRGAIVGLGILRIDAAGIEAELASTTVTGVHGLLARAEAVYAFGKMFLGTLWNVFVRPRI